MFKQGKDFVLPTMWLLITVPVWAKGFQMETSLQPSAPTSIELQIPDHQNLAGTGLDGDPNAALQQAMHFADLYNWADAGPYFARAEDLYNRRGDHRNSLYAHLGKIRSTMEQLTLPEVSEELSNTLNNDPVMQSDLRLRLFCLIVKGDIDGEIDAALMRRDWEEVLRIATELNDAKWENRASGEIGFAMFLQGDVMNARQKVAGALIGALTMHDVGAQLRYLAAVGTAFVLVGSYDQGLGYFDKALKLAESNPESGYPFIAQEGRLQAFKGMGNLAAAQQLANEVITQAKTRKKYVKEAQALITAAAISRAAKQNDQAVDQLQSAIELSEDGGFKRLLAHAQFELAGVYRSEGKLATAEELVSSAVKTTQAGGELYLVPGRLQELAELQVSQHKYRDADATYDRASQILDAMIGNVSATSAKVSLITAMSEIYAKHFALVADHLRNPEKAYSIIEQARGRVITDLLMSGAVPDTPQDREVERSISRLNLELSRAKSTAEIRKIKDEIFLAEQERWLAPNSGSWRSRPMQTIALNRVKQSLRLDEVILEYVLTDPKSYCLVITRSDARVVKLAGRHEIDSLIANFQKAMKTKYVPIDSSQQLYHILLKGIQESTRLRWIIVPDGQMHLLPFDALRDETGRYTVFSHVITHAPSASSLYLLRRAAQGRQRQTPSLLAIGAVPYDQTASANSIAIKAGYIRKDLDSLPGSKTELLAADAALHSSSNKLLLGTQATESAFKHVDLDQFQIIHMAVHGVADEVHPDRAALLLLSDSAAGEDGILQTSEILQLHTNADLVVLSACNTAVGSLQGEEGIANISRAFLLAGAKSVVSTLWSTDDVFSAYLMKQFYARLAAGEKIADALTDAKREILRTYGDAAIPYYWAGFILDGFGNHSILRTHPMRLTNADGGRTQRKQVTPGKNSSEDSLIHSRAGASQTH